MHNISDLHLQQTSVITVCAGEDFTSRLQHAFERRGRPTNFSSYEVYLSWERRSALGTLKSTGACMAFVDFDVDPIQAAEAVEYVIGTLGERATVVAVASASDPAVMLAAMRAGCHEFVQHDATGSELTEMLDRLDRTHSTSVRANIASGSIISFFGAKGGVGTTTMAVHLAIYLSRLHKKRVLLIDHHQELGHVCVYLGVDGARYQFQEVVLNVRRLDSELLSGFVARHPSRVDILSSPDVCGGGKAIEPTAIARTLEFLRSEYDYVILDCAVPSAPLNVPVIEASTVVYLVATPDVGAIRDLARYVDTLVPMDGANEKVQLVLNRTSSPNAVEVEQIEKAMKLPVAIKISSNYLELVRADNLGEPYLPDAQTELSMQFTKWANAVAGSSSPAIALKKSKNVFAMLKATPLFRMAQASTE